MDRRISGKIEEARHLNQTKGELRWAETKNFQLIASLSKSWNGGRRYETLGEYSDIGPTIVKQRAEKCWLYYEGTSLAGFGISRKIGHFFVIEELWGPLRGVFGDQIELPRIDQNRVHEFRSLLETIPRPILIRGATDNHFAHGIVRLLGVPWFNGVVVAEREVPLRLAFTIPDGYRLHDFEKGDERFLSNLHDHVFNEFISPKIFLKWVTSSDSRCVIALLKQTPIGFVIAQKRKSASIGDFDIAVLPKYHNRGIGSALLAAGLNKLSQMRVKIAIADFRTLNNSTHRLYSKFGFRPTRTYNYFALF